MKLELKVGDRVVLTGKSWTDYGKKYTPGTVVTVDSVGLDGTAYNNKVGSLTSYGGVVYKAGYTVEKYEDTPKPAGDVALHREGSEIRIDNSIGRALTIYHVSGAWFLVVTDEYAGHKIQMRMEQGAIDDLRAFLEYWSNRDKT